MHKIFRSRVAAVAAGAVVVVGLGSTAGYAAGQITGSDIKDQSIHARDIHAGGVSTSELDQRAIGWWKLSDEARDRVSSFAGQDGSDGADGTDGTDGEDGVVELESDGPYPGATQLQEGANSTERWVAGQPDTLQSSWVMCPEGKTAIGGGFSRADEGPLAQKGLQVVSSQPTQIADDGQQVYNPIEGDVDGSFVPNAWLVEGFNNGATDLIVRPHVVCATVH